ncbi:hypothetical protein AsAng_0054100 [Aureispira anguillae]|uniref:Uncharacterized protein n=1 Tax=Aureispira anguillae TaxID=2864201 RepID=A0A915YKD3_9BACT|nr:hypothetical protein AsAng_0054100 [Aureispira anguillae]
MSNFFSLKIKTISIGNLDNNKKTKKIPKGYQ